jgi:hypothetical protein
MTDTTRRTVVKGAAWSLSVIAAAIAVPHAAASQVTKPQPIACKKAPNHGHGGDRGNAWWQVTYWDEASGKTYVEMIDNGTVMSTPELRELCR